MAIFEKKILPENFEAILLGKKKCERRLQDFDIKEGDTLILKEWDGTTQLYTGRVMEKKATHIGKFRIDKDFWSEKKLEKKDIKLFLLNKKMASENVKIVVFVPESHADIVREAVGKAGAGNIGNYSFCSFSSKGTGRFKPEVGAHPAIGEVGKLEEVAEERIEFICPRDLARSIILAMKAVHPYEVVAYDVYPLEDM